VRTILFFCSAMMLAAGCTGPAEVDENQEAAKSSGGKTNGISYHGGPVLRSSSNVYYIWYGGWAGNSATSILTDLASSIGGSPYLNINSSYSDGTYHATGVVSYAGSTTDNYSLGTALSDADIETVVATHVSGGLGSLPLDPNGIYFVLASADVTATSGFCSSYCSSHNHASISGQDIKYAFVGNPDRCPSACEAQTAGPNGNAGADGMASHIAKELDEVITDPDKNAWYDSRGNENADKCAFTFGTQFTAANGAKYNITLGARQYLIQQNWVNASGGYCAMSY
jgi:hypothetical protein